MQTIYEITDAVWVIVTAVSLLVWIIDKKREKDDEIH